MDWLCDFVRGSNLVPYLIISWMVGSNFVPFLIISDVSWLVSSDFVPCLIISDVSWLVALICYAYIKESRIISSQLLVGNLTAVIYCLLTLADGCFDIQLWSVFISTFGKKWTSFFILGWI